MSSCLLGASLRFGATASAGGQAVFLADQDTDGVQELCRVELKSGAVSRLNAALVQDGDVIGFVPGA